MTDQECVRILEALIFASDTPLPLKQILQILEPEGVDRQAVKRYIAELARSLEERSSALQVVEIAGGYRLITRKEFGKWIRKLSRPKKVRLSAAALETLAIIAYKQPVTTPELEAIRGVNSSGVIKTLLERNLIKIAGRMDAVGNPMMYATTREFLEYFGLRSLKDLPTLKEFQELMEEHAEEAVPGSETEENNSIPETLETDTPENETVEKESG